MKLRAYCPADAHLVCQWLLEETAFEYWNGGKLGAYPLTADRLNEFYQTFPGMGKIALLEGRPVGHFALEQISPHQIHLGFVVIDPALRGQGLGKQLLLLALETSRRMGAREVTIGVFAENLPARRCYESLGFRQTGETSRPLKGSLQPYLELKKD